MAEKLPENAKRIVGFDKFGFTDSGEFVSLHLQTENGGTEVLTVRYDGLGAMIRYLQEVASQSRKRRMERNPSVQDEDVTASGAALLQSIDFDCEISGQAAMLVGTTANGLRASMSIPYLLIVGLQTQLPRLVAELEERQRNAARGKH